MKSGQITDPDRLFNNLSVHICTKYKEIGLELGLSLEVLTNEVETGILEMATGSKKALKMLELWRQFAQPENFTFSVVAAALEKQGFWRCAHEYCYTNK